MPQPITLITPSGYVVRQEQHGFKADELVDATHIWSLNQAQVFDADEYADDGAMLEAATDLAMSLPPTFRKRPLALAVWPTGTGNWAARPVTLPRPLYVELDYHDTTPLLPGERLTRERVEKLASLYYGDSHHAAGLGSTDELFSFLVDVADAYLAALEEEAGDDPAPFLAGATPFEAMMNGLGENIDIIRENRRG
jgi:hypothetical protein